MEYFDFLDYIKSAIEKIIGEEKKVSIRKIIKNNDQELDALTIVDDITNVSPTIYLNKYYSDYTNGRAIGDIVNEIYGLYEENCSNFQFDVSTFFDYNKIKDRIVFKVINYERNKRLLSDIPHIKKLDLAVVFYCLVDSDYIGNATVLIHNCHMDMWNITLEELLSAARENTPKLLQYELRNMNEIIKEMFLNDIQSKQISGELDCELDIEEHANEMIEGLGNSSNGIQMFVLTNRQKLNGATCMFYKNVIREFSISKNTDIYILPSSIHEVILVPATMDMSKEELSIMVRDVNEEEVDEGEILSNNVYIYDMSKDEILL